VIQEHSTDASGGFVFAPKPTVNTSYRIRFLLVDRNAYLTATSASKTVGVRAYVSVPIAPTKMSHGRKYTVYGFLKPGHKVGSTPVRIYRYHLVSGKWKLYGSYVLARASAYSGFTKYTASIVLPSKGQWRLRAYHKCTNHVAGWSAGYAYVAAT
jgi:hypothetical protein